jgi:uncharacterized LabA/DUF88 family protein
MEENIAYIDGQNLNLGAKEMGWAIDHSKFRVYLKEKYNVHVAYYCLGFRSGQEERLYKKLTDSGFILNFKMQSEKAIGNKKGNVDSDIVFEIMKTLISGEVHGKFLIVSGDGDYKKLIDFLTGKDLLKKVLFPNQKFASSLYEDLSIDYFDYLDNLDVKSKIEYDKTYIGK